MHFSFACPWVPRDNSGEMFLMTNRKHSKPLGKGHRIYDKQPFLRGKYEHQRHNMKFGIEMKLNGAKKLWSRPIYRWPKLKSHGHVPMDSPGCPGGRPTRKKWHVHKLDLCDNKLDLCHNKFDLRQAVSHSFSLLYLHNILLLFS